METRSGQLCTFAVGGLDLAVDVLRVQEVLRPRPLRRVPRAPEDVRGLINLRGRVLAAVDVGRRLGSPGRLPPESAMHVVLRAGGGAACLLVDAVGDVIPAPVSLQAPPPNAPERFRALVLGVAPGPGATLLVLDPDAVLDLASAPVAIDNPRPANAYRPAYRAEEE
ncbi:MAG: chemotaxis protein CheW [Thermoleophilia bacterium]|nr:chemotaxis protein CheW [Thermoleophilia bacterium]